jgi:hypothetical protein
MILPHHRLSLSTPLIASYPLHSSSAHSTLHSPLSNVKTYPVSTINVRQELKGLTDEHRLKKLHSHSNDHRQAGGRIGKMVSFGSTASERRKRGSKQQFNNHADSERLE